ncbi:MAG: MFS transporter [Eubacteriales bacterium]
MIDKTKNKKIRPIFAFVIVMGIVSLFSDMTHEGARSVYGSYLNLLGTSAATIGFVTGFGELLGYSLRLFTGIIADRSKKYWTITFIGYAVNMAAIPALALIPENGWIYACILIVVERIGKAIRQPSKNTLVSFAAKQIGEGKAFAIQEFLDQLGAFLGPVILFLVLFLRKGLSEFNGYVICFAVLGIPAACTLISLYAAKRKYPHPEDFDTTKEDNRKLRLQPTFIIYMIGISLLALGFADFPLITMHLARNSLIQTDYLPLAYSGAMLVDAFAALLFGWLYDRFGLRVLIASSAVSACFSIFVFGMGTLAGTIIGITMWGVGMGAQESVLKSAVTTIVSKNNRSSGFGVFETAFGVFWFIGSWIMGILYDFSPVYLIVFSVATQALSVPIFYLSYRASKKLKTSDDPAQNKEEV